ncbi:MAG: hypothetical protein J6M95_00605 [Bacilli bacterium]|nr:hypothetical protein [Bacilli bacterium]
MKMKRLIPLFLVASLLGCSQQITNNEPYIEEGEIEMKLFIDKKEINEVTWINNPSSQALKELTPFTIEMSRYGGFEQVGSLNQRIVSNDYQLTTVPGDIVLYSSSNIVIFFGSNSWSYTKLGHINLRKEELNNLLNKESVTIEIE